MKNNYNEHEIKRECDKKEMKRGESIIEHSEFNSKSTQVLGIALQAQS